MNLTKEQQAILDGAQGEVLAKVMKTLVRYGELFGAERMVPITGEYNHLVTSFGLKALTPVYDLLDQLIGEIVCPCRDRGLRQLSAAFDPQDTLSEHLLARHGAIVSPGRAVLDIAIPDY